jgi:glycine/D-amino acid oxidase-like deaminating enzyme
VVVVGAGVLGLSTALHLALLGRDVVVVERSAAGSQASGRAAGLFKSLQPDAVRTAVARRSIERALTFADWAGVPLQVHRSGSLAVARTERHAGVLAAEVAHARRWRVAVRELGPADVAARGSVYEPAGSERCWEFPDDVYVEDPPAMVSAYLQACRRQGVHMREHEEVVGVDLRRGVVAAVQTSAGRVEAPILVDAAGAWARLVAELAGAWVAVAPVRHQLLVGEPAPEVDPAGPIVRVVDAAVYVRPCRGGLMLGGFEADPLPVDLTAQRPGFDTDDLPLDVDVLARMAEALGARVPAAATAVDAVGQLRGGMFTMVPDGRFLAGPVPGVEGLWAVSGCNGSGFSSALGLGELVAQQVTGTTTYVDPSPLLPARLPRRPDAELVARGVWQYAHFYDPEGVPAVP